MSQTKFSVIIVSYNVQYFLELCLDSVTRALKGIPSEIIVVDNNSQDDSCALVRERFPQVVLVDNKDNLGFSRANNQGLAHATGRYIHFLNPDTVVPEDFYMLTGACLDNNDDIGCLGPRLVDGRGVYAPDAKKSFPSFWTSVFKVAGLSRIFPGSRYFNRYYAAQVGEHETAAVDILSGCCLIVRKSAMEQAGGSFDESYFMYCEDVDLCHRIGMAGFRNLYFPETTVIHYKGESTRKLSYRYMKIFYDAHALFVRKYYPRRLGSIYITSLRFVLGLRNVLSWGRHIFSLFKMFLLDAILLTVVTLLIKDFWFDTIAQVHPESVAVLAWTIPFFILVWLLSLFLNGAYDKPFSLFKAGRGMMLGTVLVLAGYGLLPQAYRYSRGIVLFSGVSGTVVILLVRQLLSQLHWIRLVPRGKVDYKAAIIADAGDYAETSFVLERTHYNLEVLGRVTPGTEQAPQALGSLSQLPFIQKLYRINEFIFNSGSVTYKEMIAQMERCAPLPFYKIHVPGSQAMVGSNSSRHHAEEFSLERKYRIGAADSRRNKRIVDILASLVFLLAYPLWTLRVKNRKGFLKHTLQVLQGKKTWVGYNAIVAKEKMLPLLKPAVSPPYTLMEGYRSGAFNTARLAEQYAINYAMLDDMRLIWVNLPFLGEKNEEN